MALVGQTLRLQVRYRSLDPNYEAEALSTWLSLLSPGDTVWDVGGNIGLYALLSARAVSARGRVVSWEPSPDTFAVLADHVAANGLADRITMRNAAVADRPGSLSFAVAAAGECDPTNRLTADGAGIRVPVETLDDRLASGERPAAVKIDIEGAELLALRGATAMFAPEGPRPVILLAVHPMFVGEFGYAVADIAEFFRGVRYTGYSLGGALADPVEYAEYLLIPTEKTSQVMSRLRWVT